MKVVITGALGHIGSQLLRDLVPYFPGIELLLVDNLATQRFCSLFDLPAGATYRFVEADIMDADLHALVAGADGLVHLAALTDAASSFDRQVQVEQVNFDGAVRTAAACKAAGVPMLFFSTTSVYGDQSDLVDETCTHLAPQSPYANAKLKAEQHLQREAADGLRVAVFRCGTIFGVSPGMRFHTAINKFCWQASQGEALTVWSTALDQVRPYCDLQDAIAATAHLLANPALFDGRIYNVLTCNATVRHITDAITAHVPDTTVSLVEHKIMNLLSYNVSDARIRATGFTPKGDLRAGIAATLLRLRGLASARL